MPKHTKGWHPADIKAAVQKQGTNLRRLALEAGLFESACRVALHRPCLIGETVIAECIGVAAHRLWPERYDADGAPLHRHSKHVHRIARQQASQRQKAQAA